MLITAGERKATALLCMALHDLGVAGRQLHRQPGRLHHRHHPHQRQDPRGAARPPRGRAARRAHARGRRLPGRVRPSATSPSSAGAAPTPPRSRWPTRSAPTRASSTPTCPACSPPTPAWCPTRAPHGDGQLRRDARDDRRAAARSRPCGRSSSPAPGACGCTSDQRSPGSPAPGCKRRIRPWSRPSSRPSSTTRRRPRSRSSGVPDQPGIAARLFRLLADADVNVDMIVQNTSEHGVTDISFTVPHDDLADEPGDHLGARRRDLGHRGHHATAASPG